MTIRYKSSTFDLTDTNVTSVLTCPADATIIIKSVQANHKTASNVDVDVFLHKSGGSAVEISHSQLNKNFVNMVTSSLNMEANDILKIQASSANTITGAISYALIDRSQENG
jgi:hypothetical protein|tara:strand:+ start:879 stop:1214 length:336 start_codon:yes stop_codon:yes gene_type:complete